MRKAFLRMLITVSVAIAIAPLLSTLVAQNTIGPTKRASRPVDVSRTPVVIAVSDTFPIRNADVVILRRPNAAIPDLILVKKGTEDGHKLARAVRMLEGLRAQFGVAPATEMVVRVPSTGAVGPYEVEAGSWVEYLRSVNPERLRRLPGLGQVPYLRLMLANNAVRVASPRTKR